MLSLATRQGCMACHGVERRIVGPSFREVAAKQGSIASVATLGKFLRDEGGVAQRAGVAALAKRGSEAFPTLIDALRSKNFRAEGAAARTIARIGLRGSVVNSG